MIQNQKKNKRMGWKESDKSKLIMWQKCQHFGGWHVPHISGLSNTIDVCFGLYIYKWGH